jgi:hypothetical protein
MAMVPPSARSPDASSHHSRPSYPRPTPLQSLSKPQRDSLLKARRLLSKDPAVAAAAIALHEAEAGSPAAPAGSRAAACSSSAFGSGVLASEHLERCIAFCVVCLDEQLYDLLLDGGPSGGAAATGAAGGGRAVAGAEQRAAALAAAPLYVLRTRSWPPAIGGGAAGAGGGAGKGGGGRPGGGRSGVGPPPLAHPELLMLLDELLVRAPCPALCCNAKALLRVRRGNWGDCADAQSARTGHLFIPAAARGCRCWSGS